MLYYSHTNEDNRLEKELLQSSACDTAIVIVGSGERVLALMNNKACKKVLAVDINKEAIFLLQLKLEAITHLTNEEYFQFTGHYTAQANSRLDYFEKIRSHLPAELCYYWEQKYNYTKKGIFYAGHFEAFLDKVRPVINLFFGKKFQRIFDYDYFNARIFPGTRWKLICWIFSQKWVYKFWGNKDLAFIGPGSHSERIPAALNEIIKKGKASSCFMAHLIFKGHLRKMLEKDLPPPLQGNVLNAIRSRIINREISVEYYEDDLLNCIKQKRGKWQNRFLFLHQIF
ncbi:MAG: DUF3419 family protein [Chitinophagaceae bacterium]|nr:DUF3419 family protein [Chitinophagaceae bacterium]